MNVWGIHLANGSNEADLPAINALGCDWYVALHGQLDDLVALLRMRPGTKGIVRLFWRDMLKATPQRLAAECAILWTQMQAAGITDLILGNELNNAVEGEVFLAAETALRLKMRAEAVRSACPGIRLHMPAFSPPLAGLVCYEACRTHHTDDAFDVVDIHAYHPTNADTALAWVDKIAAIFPDKPCAVTEYNFGAGNSVDQYHYAQEAVKFFKGIEVRRQRVECANVFIWRWYNPDSSLKTTVNVKGQPIEQLLGQATKVSVMPTTEVRGIDVSNWQGNIDWQAVKAAGIQFAFCKATEGSMFKDANFAINWRAMKQYGIVRGAYHYITDDMTPEAQAAFFLATVGPLEQGDMLALDVEAGEGDLSARVITFLSYVERQTGYRMHIYSNPSFIEAHGLNIPTVACNPLWLAVDWHDADPA